MSVRDGKDKLQPLINYLATRPVTTALIGIFWLFYLFQIVALIFTTPEIMASLFYVRYSHLEYVWTWFTAPFGHGNIAHLLFNTAIAFWVGSWAESEVTTRNYLSAFIIGGAITAVLGTLVSIVTPNHLFIDLGLLTRPEPNPPTIYGGIGSSMGWFCVLGMMFALRPTGKTSFLIYYPQRWVGFAILFVVSLLGTVTDISVFGLPIGHPFHLVGLVVGGIYGILIAHYPAPSIS